MPTPTGDITSTETWAAAPEEVVSEVVPDLELIEEVADDNQDRTSGES